MTKTEWKKIKIAYCKVCGRVLTGKKSVQDGIGKGCKKKTIDSYKNLEKRGQLRLFD